MPDLPPPKRRWEPHAASHTLPLRPTADPCDPTIDSPRRDTPLTRYAELHCKTNFSFLEGASHPDELVERAAQLGYAALAITDRNSLAGVVRAHTAARPLGLKLILGAEITPHDAPHAVLLATDRASYGRLARLITTGRRRAAKGDCLLAFDDLAAHADGLIAAVIPPPHGRPPTTPDFTTPNPLPRASNLETLGRYRDLFGDRCYLLAELHYGPDDRKRLAELAELARSARVPLAAANDVHYHLAQRQALHDVLTAVRLGRTVADAKGDLFPNTERHLKTPDEMAARFAPLPHAIERTIEIADRAKFSLDELRYEYPEELAPPGSTTSRFLHQLTWAGAHQRYPHGIPPKVHALLDHELRLIEDLHYEPYFLTVWDLVRFARSRNILCQGRGSAANSAVCYCLGVTSVDPERIDVLFERFISRERNEAPDIDVDFEHDRREEVMQYLYEKYGRERAGLTAEVVSYRLRSAVRDVGKALGLSLDRVDALAKNLESYGAGDGIEPRCLEIGLDPDSALGRQLLDLVRQLIGFPRHLSQHVGGMVMTRGPLCELVPIENAAMPDRTVIQWDKDDLDQLGILKVDCLALGMLTAIHKCFDLVERHTGRAWTLARVPAEDPAVYDMICRSDTVGVFQIESRAQMSMLPRLRPRCFYDLVIEVAIVRPGPIQGQMVHPYLRRRAGLEPVQYPTEAVRQVLEKTLGVPLFQEQAMRLAVVAAGFTPDQADQLRRAMGAWRRPGIIEQFRNKLVDGMKANGYSAEFAERVFLQLQGFGEYGFPESHAASFALLVYVSAWLKCHHPAAFTAALLNSQPMGFYAPAQLVRDAREHGVTVRPVDVNASDWQCTLEPAGTALAEQPPPAGTRSPFALRLGLCMIRGLSQTFAERIVAARGDRPFQSIEEFSHRTGLRQPVLVRLAKADAFSTLRLDRRSALWHTLAHAEPMPLFDGIASGETAAELTPLQLAEQVAADYRASGLSLRAHPLALMRPALKDRRVARAADLPNLPAGRHVRVAGLVLVRQRPGTARGITFVTLEDETGIANLIVHAETWARYHHAAATAQALLAHGRLERQGDVIHVIAHRLENLSDLLHGITHPSRNFH